MNLTISGLDKLIEYHTSQYHIRNQKNENLKLAVWLGFHRALTENMLNRIKNVSTHTQPFC